jgi:hypothetical protein
MVAATDAIGQVTTISNEDAECRRHRAGDSLRRPRRSKVCARCAASLDGARDGPGRGSTRRRPGPLRDGAGVCRDGAFGTGCYS